jgi:hypothetical protein
MKLLGDPVPIDYPTNYRYFYCGDVDGDGIPDVINSNGEMIFFKGLPTKATDPVLATDDLIVRSAEACTVDASKPNEPVVRKPTVLEARTQALKGPQKQRLVLIRFTDLPKLAGVGRATLELSTDPKLERFPLVGAAGCDVSCSEIRDDWDAARATYAEAAPGKTWSPRELDAGGKFLALARQIDSVKPVQTLTWDVTPAVRAALQAGRTSISLLVRAEFTGNYGAGAGYHFCGPDWPRIESQPRLILKKEP